MRFSPALLAVLTAAATFGLTAPAVAQTRSTAVSDSPEGIEPAPKNLTVPTAAPIAAPGSESAQTAPLDRASQQPTAGQDRENSGVAELASSSEESEASAVTATDVSANVAATSVASASGTNSSAVSPDASAIASSSDSNSPAIGSEVTVSPATSPAASPAASPATATDLGTPAELAQASPVPGTPAPTTPGTVPAPPSVTPEPAQAAPEPQVLVSEVAVSGSAGELPTNLVDEVYGAIRTRAGQTTTRSQLQADINSVFATGFFTNVRAVPEDTPLGVRVTFIVEPNPVLRAVQVQDSEVLPAAEITRIFGPQYGNILNFRDLQRGVTQLNEWYRTNGYVLARVADVQQQRPQVSPDGTVTLSVDEGVIESIGIRFVTEEGETTDEDGEPLDGKTRDYVILREFRTQPGNVFNQQQIQADLQRAFGLGIFQDLQLRLNPGQNPRQVAVTVDVVERNTGSLAVGGGVSSASGLFGTLSYQEQNLGGNNQRLAAEVQFGEREAQFDIGFTDPWIGGDPLRTSYTVSAFSRRSVPLVFQGGDTEVDLPNGDRPRILRLGGGISFGRPDDPFEPRWRFSTGLQYQRVRIQDRDGTLTPRDELGNDLSFSGTGLDDLFLVSFAASNDNRNSASTPTSGSLLRLSTEQSIPLGDGNILLNRLRGSYSYFIPVRFTNFTEGPQTLAFNLQGGVVLGDLPPYEAFSMGGTDSVRGYEAGEVGSGRAFVQGTVEYRFPIFSVVGGVLFADVGSTLGTDDNVPGRPSVIRDKPGFGFGVGVGIRVRSPLGALRVDYAVNDEGDSQIHFGLGERF